MENTWKIISFNSNQFEFGSLHPLYGNTQLVWSEISIQNMLKLYHNSITLDFDKYQPHSNQKANKTIRRFQVALRSNENLFLAMRSA